MLSPGVVFYCVLVPGFDPFSLPFSGGDRLGLPGTFSVLSFLATSRVVFFASSFALLRLRSVLTAFGSGLVGLVAAGPLAPLSATRFPLRGCFYLLCSPGFERTY